MTVPEMNERLTPRQRQVVELVLRGMCNKEISRTLGIETGTVKLHMVAILQRLNLASRSKLMAAYAAERTAS